MNKKVISVLSMLVLTAGLLSGCGSSSGSSSSSSSSDKVKTYIVGTSNNYKPFAYIDDSKNVAGFDVAVLQEVAKRTKDIKFQFQAMDFANLFVSLDSKKIDLVGCELEINDQRKQKYLFGDEAYNTFPVRVRVNGDRTDINSIDDLKGKSIVVSAATNEQTIIEKYNAEHNNAIKMVLNNGNADDTINQMKSGRVDATLSTEFDTIYTNKTKGTNFKNVGKLLSDSKTYFLFRKDETDLKTKVDKALKDMKKDGTLKKLSIKYLYKDYLGEDTGN